MPTEVIIPMITAMISGGFTSFVVVLKTRLTQKDRMSHAFNELVDTLDDLEIHINNQEGQIRDLRHRLQQAERRDDEKTMYIRRIGHWFDKTCEILDPDWLARNPKPSLPDSLRDSIGKEKLK